MICPPSTSNIKGGEKYWSFVEIYQLHFWEDSEWFSKERAQYIFCSFISSYRTFHQIPLPVVTGRKAGENERSTSSYFGTQTNLKKSRILSKITQKNREYNPRSCFSSKTKRQPSSSLWTLSSSNTKWDTSISKIQLLSSSKIQCKCSNHRPHHRFRSFSNFL